MKKYLFLILSLVLIVTLPFSKNIKAEESIATNDTVNIHYFRYNEDFENWKVWLWPDGGTGKFVHFDESTVNGNWVSLSLDLTDEANADYLGVEKFGLLVVNGAGETWGERDISYDRYFNLNFVGGECNVYLGQGDGNIGTSLDDPNGPDTSHKFLLANFLDEKTIEFTATKVLTNFTLLADDVEITPSTKLVDGTTYTLTLSDEVDLKKKYEISADFDGITKKIEVGFSALYDTEQFEKEFDYSGDLGVNYSKAQSTFKVWSPLSDKITLRLYNQGLSTHDNNGNLSKEDTPYSEVELTKKENGLFSTTVSGDLAGKYYTYYVERGIHKNEVVDPYAYSTGANGKRGMVVNFDELNPTDWQYDSRPDTVTNYTDNIIYELHVRDLTSHSSWNGNDDNRGKFLGLVEEGTTYNGYTTGLDHIKELGVTSVHLLPVHDFGFVDETRLDEKGYFDKTDGGFNWGYMTENYNSLEGSYSTNPFDGTSRVSEFKEMVQGFHDNDIRVIMDVVYNHTSSGSDSNFDVLMPGYYHRLNADGSFSNGSGCGNETASERTMMQKLIVDSIVFYAKEYNISGFRFDLMQLHDVETMNSVAKAVHEIDPSIIIYGEPWDAGGSALDPSVAAGKDNYTQMPNVAIFNDEIRDAVKGSVFASTAGGFVQGASDDTTVNSIQRGLTGTTAPSQMVNYVSAHDNNTLYDKLRLTGLKSTQLEYAHKQSNAIVLLSQGIPFLHAGVELCRTKPSEVEGELYSHNSYNESDAVNQIRWDKKGDNIEMFNYYKALIQIRKDHPAFRMMSFDEVSEHCEFITSPDGSIVLRIKGNANGDTWDDIIIAFNNTSSAKTFDLPEGEWVVVGDKLGIDLTGLYNADTTMTLTSYDTVIMYSGITLPAEDSSNIGVIIAVTISIIAVLGIAGGLGFVFLKKKEA
ncbi:MAG: type I pullulanase [bacterium]